MISFNSLTPDFEIQDPNTFKNWLVSVIQSENKLIGDIQYIFCDDNYLLEINKNYLKHDTLTDIITFPSTISDTVLSGEIYISIPRVTENAEQNQDKFVNELVRVLVHGILHLIGYNDKTPSEKREMRAKEDYYLDLQP